MQVEYETFLPIFSEKLDPTRFGDYSGKVRIKLTHPDSNWRFANADDDYQLTVFEKGSSPLSEQNAIQASGCSKLGDFSVRLWTLSGDLKSIGKEHILSNQFIDRDVYVAAIKNGFDVRPECLAAAQILINAGLAIPTESQNY